MSSERQAKPFWDTLFSRHKSGQTSATDPATALTAGEQPAKINMAEDQRKALEQAIPFHRPAALPATPQVAGFSFEPLDSAAEPGEVKPKERPVEVEPYRKKYKKYGRDVCLPGGDEPYDVLMDNSDQSHRGVDSVSPL
jgi:hypothetical protein